ncbi:MAG: hypothetical protein CVV27_15060 [Candidatus Melainabacteria bacterium HGW-Melainabacteria-1]|nr:MAG: hypothetical protein CVV27_15060 [Candidatus Melainabacteria bacterium HGW-Melainabacteria-1]
MVTKVHKLLLVPALLAIMTTAPAHAQTYGDEVQLKEFSFEQDTDFEYLSRFVRNYYESDLGMSTSDYGRLQIAEGNIRENRPIKALEQLRDLREVYPEALPVSVLMARAYLGMNEPEKALLILNDARQQLDPLEDEDQPALFDLVQLQVKAYQAQKQPEHALRVSSIVGAGLPANNVAEASRARPAPTQSGVVPCSLPPDQVWGRLCVRSLQGISVQAPNCVIASGSRNDVFRTSLARSSADETPHAHSVDYLSRAMPFLISVEPQL